MRRKISLPVVDLPHPLSPTSPRVSPFSRSKAHPVHGVDMPDGSLEKPAFYGEVLLQAVDVEQLVWFIRKPSLHVQPAADLVAVCGQL